MLVSHCILMLAIILFKLPFASILDVILFLSWAFDLASYVLQTIMLFLHMQNLQIRKCHCSTMAKCGSQAL